MPKYDVLAVFKYSPDLAGRYKARKEALRFNSQEDIEAEENAIRTMQERTMKDLTRIVNLAFDDIKKKSPRSLIDYEFLRSAKGVIPIFAPKEWKVRIVVFNELEAMGFREARSSAILLSRPRRGEVWKTWVYACYKEAEVEITT